MKQEIQILLKGVLATSIFVGNLWAVDIANDKSAINLAGKQRMFTQKALKDYAMVGMGNTFGNPKADLTSTINDFNDHLKSLQAYAKDDATKSSLKEVASLWTPIKKTLEEAPSLDKVVKLQNDLDALLKASDTTTKMFTKASGKASAKIVDISGRQRMLSQRMASLYMLKVWGVKDPEFKRKLNDSMKLFKSSQEILEAEKVDSDEIKKILANVDRSFMFFEMMNRSKSKFIPTLIYKKSDDILKEMNKATELYVKEQLK